MTSEIDKIWKIFKPIEDFIFDVFPKPNISKINTKYVKLLYQIKFKINSNTIVNSKYLKKRTITKFEEYSKKLIDLKNRVKEIKKDIDNELIFDSKSYSCTMGRIDYCIDLISLFIDYLSHNAHDLLDADSLQQKVINVAV